MVRNFKRNKYYYGGYKLSVVPHKTSKYFAKKEQSIEAPAQQEQTTKADLEVEQATRANVDMKNQVN